MKCNNARAEKIDGRYRLTIPPEYQEEKEAVLKQAVEKYNGFVHVEISKVRKPKSIEANALFHSVLTEYYLSGLHSCKSWQELKNQLKYQFGYGFIHTLTLPDGEKYGVLKSVGDYNSKELSDLIDGTIKDMLIKGVVSTKFKDILNEIKFEV